MSTQTVSILLGQTESKEMMLSLIHRDVAFFTYPDPQTRLAAIQEIFAPDVIWFDFDGTTHHGHDGLLARSSLLLGQLSGTIHRAEGEASVSQNMATQRWQVMRAGVGSDIEQAPLIRGGDVIVVQDQKIKLLWSWVDSFDKAMFPELGVATQSVEA